MKNAKRTNKAGFTLIEIIIVIAVLGILALIAIPRYAGFTLEAKNKVDISNARIMTGIAAAHNASTGSYPAWPVSFDKIELSSNPDAKEYFSGDIEIQNSANSFEYDPSTGTVTISGTSVVVPPVPTESDASLQSLTVSAGTLTPAFSSGVTSYSVTLPAGTTTPPTISASVKIAGASANVSNANSLPGSGSVTVTSKDGTATNTYTVSFTVASAPAPTEYTITFNSNGGSAVSSITQATGTAITAPANPTKTGFTFAGWNPAVPPTMPSSNLTLNAQWTVSTATITFNSNGGSTVPSITHEVGTPVIAPAAPTRTGYTFTGWSPALPGTMPEGGMTVTAQWSQNVTATGATTSNRTQSSTGTGQNRVWTISTDVTITLSNGSSYTHGRVTGTVTSPNVVPVTVNVHGTATGGVQYNLNVTF